MPPTMRNIQASLKSLATVGKFDIAGFGAPMSGTGIFAVSGQGGNVITPSTGQGICGKGSIYTDANTGVQYFNEGTAAAPYWTPLNPFHPALLYAGTDFRDGVGKAIADTAATYTIPGSGVRIFGNAIIDVDSGLVIAIDEDGPIASLIASATSGDVAALGMGITTSVPYQPDTHGPLVVEALIASGTALTARRIMLGFIGTAADALVSPSTGAAVTITLVQDDQALMLMDSGLTNASGIFLPHNKSDEAATILTTATGVDISQTMPAAGTYTRWRVEISAGGVMTAFIDRVQVGQILAALDADEELAPLLAIVSLAAATKTLLIKRFATWGLRRSGNF